MDPEADATSFVMPEADVLIEAEYKWKDSILLAKAQEAAKKGLSGYKDEALYRPAQKEELNEAVAAGTEAIEKVTDTAGVEAALAAAKKAMDAIKTDAQLAAEEQQAALTKAKSGAKEELKKYKEESLYRPAQKEELKAAIASGTEAIEQAADAAGVEAALEAAKKVIDTIKTDAQLTAEEQLQNEKPPVQDPAQNVKDPVPNPQNSLPKVGSVHKSGKLWYKILSSDKGSKTVEVKSPVKKSSEKLTVPAVVKIDGYTYKVVSIGKKAFYRNKKLVQITIGKSITGIGKQAFGGCGKLKKVLIKSVKIKKIAKNAFTGIAKDARITVPKKKLADYKKLLRKANTASCVKIVK